MTVLTMQPQLVVALQLLPLRQQQQQKQKTQKTQQQPSPQRVAQLEPVQRLQSPPQR
jgi:hypothetical protein